MGLLRFWAREHLRLAAALVALAALASGLLAVSLPTGPPQAAHGVVTSLGFSETEEGSRPYAILAVEGRSVRAALHAGSLCRVGDKVALSRQRTAVGSRYVAAPPGCVRP